MNSFLSIEFELGQLRGIIEALAQTSKEERKTNSDERREILIKLDRLEERMTQLEFKFDPLVEKTKQHETDIKELKLIHTKVAAVIGFLSAMGGIIISAMWYLLTHWNEIFSTIRQVMSGWR